MIGRANPVGPTLEAALVSIARAIDAPPTHERYTQVEVAIPDVALELLFDALPAEDAVLWSPPGEDTVLGLGVAALLEASGPRRFAALREAAAELPAWARLYCGFSFAPGSRPSAPFGDARAVLPRFVLRRGTEGAWLAVTLDRGEPDRAGLHAQLSAIAAALAATPTTPPSDALRAVEERAEEADAFRALVAEARRAVRDHAFDKVVVHRQTRLVAHPNRGPGAILAHLAESQPTSTRFAFRVRGEVFLGATPERLVRRAGRAIFADVLAGSLPRDGADVGPEALLASEKDLAEHELTRGAIVEALRPACATLREEGPRVRALPHLYHLHTAIEGQLATRTHVLELVAALHPTPAVGGSPRDAALAFIAAREPSPRGWYGAPVGWFAPDGDGDFAVALRCALVQPGETTLYAGAGIVADSNPERELAETTSKRRAMLTALGLVLGTAGNRAG